MLSEVASFNVAPTVPLLVYLKRVPVFSLESDVKHGTNIEHNQTIKKGKDCRVLSPNSMLERLSMRKKKSNLVFIDINSSIFSMFYNISAIQR